MRSDAGTRREMLRLYYYNIIKSAGLTESPPVLASEKCALAQ